MTTERVVRALASVGLLAVTLAGAPVHAEADPGAGAAAAAAPVDGAVRDARGRVSALVHARGSLEAAVAAAHDAGLDVGTRYGTIDVFVAYGTAGGFLDVAASPWVERVEHNAPLQLLTDTSHTATRGEDVLDGALAGGAAFDGTGVGVAVIDSGVDGLHPDLQSRMGGNVRIVCSASGGLAFPQWGLGFSECRGPKVAVPLPDTDTPAAGGHGTHVAGIVAGDGAASDATYHGAAPAATLYGVGVGTTLLVENALDGLAWVLDNHDRVSPSIRVVNNSWGSGPGRPSEDSVLLGATVKLVNRLVGEGLTVVFAAGNSGGDGSHLATTAECTIPTEGVICVANYDDGNVGTRDGAMNETSSRGWAGDPRSWPDVSAPGTLIVSTCRLTLPVCAVHNGHRLSPPNSYAHLTGTSMAAPHVAGVAAQVLQADPHLTPAEVENIIEDTAHQLTTGAEYDREPANRDHLSSFDKGHGLVDAVAAVEAVLSPLAVTSPTPATSLAGVTTVAGTAAYGTEVTVAVDGVVAASAHRVHPTWQVSVDTAAIADGPHVLSVTLHSGPREVATVDIPVTVDNDAQLHSS